MSDEADACMVDRNIVSARSRVGDQPFLNRILGSDYGIRGSERFISKERAGQGII